MKKDFTNTTEYEYKGYYIYKITRKDYCVFGETSIIIHTSTLKAAKTAIDNM